MKYAAATTWQNVYRYFGLKFGKLNVTVRLDKAIIASEGGHIAVWAGVNDENNRSWAQGGVMMVSGDTLPSAYIETKIGSNPDGYTVRSWRMTGYSQKVKVKLRRYRGMWRVRIKVGKMEASSHEVPIRKPTVDAVLEIYEKASAVGHISGREVRGHV